MNDRDPHQALKSEIIEKGSSGRAAFALARLQWSKNDIGFSLHVSPNSFSTAGLQVPDFLSYLGFKRSGCAFLERRECYVRWVSSDLKLTGFPQIFDQAFANTVEAQNDLEKCGFFFEQPEGWGYFFGKQSRGRSQRDYQLSGNGHTAASRKPLKESEDEVFRFKFIWIETDDRKGWVVHVRPKHPPLSSEIRSVFEFLGLNSFTECPEYDFESCDWHSIAYKSGRDHFFDGNANVAHAWFDAHAKHFSVGIEKLLAANALIEKAGLTFLPFSAPQTRLN